MAKSKSKKVLRNIYIDEVTASKIDSLAKDKSRNPTWVASRLVEAAVKKGLKIAL